MRNQYRETYHSMAIGYPGAEYLENATGFFVLRCTGGEWDAQLEAIKVGAVTHARGMVQAMFTAQAVEDVEAEMAERAEAGFKTIMEVA